MEIVNVVAPDCSRPVDSWYRYGCRISCAAMALSRGYDCSNGGIRVSCADWGNWKNWELLKKESDSVLIRRILGSCRTTLSLSPYFLQ